MILKAMGAVLVLGSGLLTVLVQAAGTTIPTSEVVQTGGLVGGYGLAVFVFSIYRSEKKDSEARYFALAERCLSALEHGTTAIVELRGEIRQHQTGGTTR